MLFHCLQLGGIFDLMRAVVTVGHDGGRGLDPAVESIQVIEAVVRHLDHIGSPDGGIGVFRQQCFCLQIGVTQHHDGLAANSQAQDGGHAVAIPEGEAGDLLFFDCILVGI